VRRDPDNEIVLECISFLITSHSFLVYFGGYLVSEMNEING